MYKGKIKEQFLNRIQKTIEQQPGLTQNMIIVKSGLSKETGKAFLDELSKPMKIVSFRHGNKTLYFPNKPELIVNFIYENEIVRRLELMGLRREVINEDEQKEIIRSFLKIDNGKLVGTKGPLDIFEMIQEKAKK